MKEKIKLFFAIYGLGMGGAEKSLVNLLSEIDYSLFEVDLYVFDYYNISSDNTKFLELPSKINIIKPDKNMVFLTTRKIKNMICNFSLKRLFYKGVSKFKTIHIKNSYLKNQVLWETSYKKILPVLEKEYDCAISYMQSFPNYFVIDKVQAKRKLLWVHTDYSDLSLGKDYDENYFKSADNVVTISERCVSKLEESFPQIHNFKCLYNLTPINKVKNLSNEYIPNEYTKSTLNLLSIGRLVYDKGFDIAINAARELVKSKIDFKWVILGDGPLMNELEDMIDDSLKNHIYLLGNKNNPYPYFKHCDFVIQTSRLEGKSIVLDEAKIFYKPIICTNYSTVSDQLIDNFNGIIVPMNDYISLKNAIIKLFNDEKLQKSIIENLKNEKFMTVKDYETLFLNGD